MNIELRQRTEETVITYFEKTRDARVRRFLPQKATTVEEAIADYYRTLLPEADSYGRAVYAEGVHVGDIWCYSIQPEEPNAMVSYCVFDPACWNRGVATKALSLFLEEISRMFSLKTVGAFTYSANIPSIRVLLRNGFVELETFTEDGVESKYFQREH